MAEPKLPTTQTSFAEDAHTPFQFVDETSVGSDSDRQLAPFQRNTPDEPVAQASFGPVTQTASRCWVVPKGLRPDNVIVSDRPTLTEGRFAGLAQFTHGRLTRPQAPKASTTTPFRSSGPQHR
jgi:hypothetical protein